MKTQSRSTWALALSAGLLLLVQAACGRGNNADDEGDSPDGTGATTSAGGSSSNPQAGASSVAGSVVTTGGAAPTTAGTGPVSMAGTTSTTGGVTGAGGMGGPTKPIWPDGRGPSVAFTTYEAEAMDTNAMKTVVSRAFGRLSG